MTREEILLKIEEAKTNKHLSEHDRTQILAMYQKRLVTIDENPNSVNRDKKNLEIIHEFYSFRQTFVTKEELVNKGFDFSQWFSTSNLTHFFDVEENSFEYKDFKCGVYYIKTRDKNLEKTDLKARLFFQIIKLEFDRNTAEFNNAIKLLRDRKYAAGHAWAYKFDRDMENDSAGDKADEQLETVNLQIDRTLPRLQQLIESMTHTVHVFKDLYSRLEEKRSEDENWI